MQRFFQGLSAFVGFASTALLVFILLILQPVRLGAESAPPPLPPDGDIDSGGEIPVPPADAGIDADVDAEVPDIDATPTPDVDATPAPDADLANPPDDEGCSCRIGAGGPARRHAPAGAALLGVAVVAAAFARRRKS